MGILLNKREKSLFDRINSEVYVLAGAEDVLLWKWQKYFGNVSSVSGSVDCLYGEPIPNTKHYKSYKIIAYFERPTSTYDSTDEGLQHIKEGRIYVSRLILERAKVPKDAEEKEHVNVGDVFEFFKKGNRFTFEVRNVEKDGWINDQDTWTQYIADVVYLSSFVPDKKLAGST